MRPRSTSIIAATEAIGLVMDAPTGSRRLALIVEHGNDIYARVGPLLRAVSAASAAP